MTSEIFVLVDCLLVEGVDLGLDLHQFEGRLGLGRVGLFVDCQQFPGTPEFSNPPIAPHSLHFLQLQNTSILSPDYLESVGLINSIKTSIRYLLYLIL